MQFAEFLNEGSPAHLRILSLPTCVGFGTGGSVLPVRAFLGSLVHPASLCLAASLPITSRLCICFLQIRPTGLDVLFHLHARASSCVTLGSCHTESALDSSPAVHRLCLLLRLRSRLTLGRRALPRNPQAFGGADSHRPFRYSYRHSLFHPVHMSFRSCFVPDGTLPYPCFRMPQLRFRT